VAALTLLGLAAAVPHALDYIYDNIDVIIFKKSESESYAGRTEWTRVAWEAFFATHGLGVGLGTADVELVRRPSEQYRDHRNSTP
jgi:hypothetical protein